MREIVFLLEEKSMREALNLILPKLLPPEVTFRLIAHEGKSDLEASLPRKLKGWQNPEARFVVVRDQDAADCHILKKHLLELCPETKRHCCLVRIVCRELESWFLGDLNAVSLAFDQPRLASLQTKRKFRNPDLLGNAFHELKQLIATYQKVGGARTIAPHLNLRENHSPSFRVFISGVERLCTTFTDSSA
jgi:hypothetical protein